MQVEVRLFAVLRERAGMDRLILEVAGEAISADALKAEIARACPAIAPLLSVVRMAVNEAFATRDQEIRPGDDVALIPPVSGGSGLGPFEVRNEPLDLAEVERAVRAPSCGALATFSGVVRDHTGPHAVEALEYEAYRPMAERVLRQIGGEIQARFPDARVAILHRVGRLAVGEVSVVIAVATPHRADAFAGCRQAIERLKEDVPIWKKEIRADGSVWVGVGS